MRRIRCSMILRTGSCSTEFITQHGWVVHFRHLRQNIQTVMTCTGWLRLVGSIKLQFSFAKELYKRDYIQTMMSCTGWRRLIGCLKLQVIFRKRATKYRALLRKMTCTDKASDGSSPPCTPDMIDRVGRIQHTLAFRREATVGLTDNHTNTHTHTHTYEYRFIHTYTTYWWL